MHSNFLKRTSTSKPIKSRFVYGGLLITVLLSACDQEKLQQTKSIGSEQSLQQGNTPPSDKIQTAKQIINQGFYPNSDQSAVTNQAEISIDPNAQLIQDLGFATAQDTQILNTEEEQAHKPFCLGSNEGVSAVNIEQACERISKRLASVSMKSCLAANLTATGCHSVQEFPILVSTFLPIEGKKPQGRILLIGGTHGDELTSVSMTFRWIEKLNKFHSGLFNWRLIPMMNPDGVLNRKAQRTNYNGVDLNRNLPSENWENTALKYWETKVGKNPRRYPGTKSASEPETQWLLDEISSFKPDAIISIHAPYGVVDFDSLLLNTAPKSLGKLHLNLLGTYPGSLGNYAGMNLNIPVITLELPNAWEMPSQKDSTKIWEDIVQWLKKNINSEIVDNSARKN